jgi:hypothetical protein
MRGSDSERCSVMLRLLIFLLLTAGCSCHKLSVRSEYVTENYLASYHVETPDPRRGCPFIGQQLIISWYIPDALWHGQQIDLDFIIRFRNNEEQHQVVFSHKPIGTYVYELQDEEFARVGGILTYKVDLIEDGEVTETWIHPLWQERILINET